MRMTNRLTLACAAILAAGVTALNLSSRQSALAQETQSTDRPGAGVDQPPRQTRDGRRERGDGEGRGRESIERAMKGVDRALEKLRPQLNDASKKDENLRLIGEMQRGCIAAKSQPLPPSAISQLKVVAPDANPNDAFRTEMIVVVRKLLDAEQALLDKKPETVRALLAEVEKLRDAAHDKYGVKE